MTSAAYRQCQSCHQLHPAPAAIPYHAFTCPRCQPRPPRFPRLRQWWQANQLGLLWLMMMLAAVGLLAIGVLWAGMR